MAPAPQTVIRVDHDILGYFFYVINIDSVTIIIITDILIIIMLLMKKNHSENQAKG